MFKPSMTMADKALAKLKVMRRVTVRDIKKLDNLAYVRYYIEDVPIIYTFRDNSVFSIFIVMLTCNFKT